VNFGKLFCSGNIYTHILTMVKEVYKFIAIWLLKLCLFMRGLCKSVFLPITMIPVLKLAIPESQVKVFSGANLDNSYNYWGMDVPRRYHESRPDHF